MDKREKKLEVQYQRAIDKMAKNIIEKGELPNSWMDILSCNGGNRKKFVEDLFMSVCRQIRIQHQKQLNPIYKNLRLVKAKETYLKRMYTTGEMKNAQYKKEMAQLASENSHFYQYLDDITLEERLLDIVPENEVLYLENCLDRYASNSQKTRNASLIYEYMFFKKQQLKNSPQMEDLDSKSISSTALEYQKWMVKKGICVPEGAFSLLQTVCDTLPSLENKALIYKKKNFC